MMVVSIIGDAFVDILVPTRDINPGETNQRAIVCTCGGTANVAIELSKLDQRSAFIGRVGRDPFGVRFKENLAQNNILDQTFTDAKNPTGLCISLIDASGERAMVVNRGANDFFDADEMESILDNITSSEVAYFSGYSLQNPKNYVIIENIMQECVNHQCTVYFNPGAPNIIEKKFERLIKSFVDVLILNYDEAKAIANASSMQEIILALNQLTSLVVITMGMNGCLLLCRDNAIPIKPDRRITAYDTTGAGDAFAAGFIHGMLKTQSLYKSCEYGNNVASKLIHEKGRLFRCTY